MLTAKLVRALLKYDRKSGLFYWRRNRGNVKVGDIAGNVHAARGNVDIGINYRLHKAHRLAWLYVTGSWPNGPIDHVDGNQQNNAWQNLRLSTAKLNSQNLRDAHADCESGLLGAYRNGRKFCSRIMANGEDHWLGNFETALEAHNAYILAKRALHESNTL